METVRNQSKRKTAGNILLIAGCVVQTIALWNEYAWYEACAKYTTLFSLVILVACGLLIVPAKKAIRDPWFWAAFAAAAVAAINIYLTGSGKGAFLTAADVLIVAYLADKTELTRIGMLFMFVYTGFFFYYWTFDVKGYFKGYNTNYGGLVLICGFVFAITGLIAWRCELKEKEPSGAIFLTGFILFMFVWGYNIIAWYRARCALLGFVVFAILLVIPAKVWKNKVFHTLLTLATTLGAIAVSLLYVWIGKSASFNVQVFYKDIISGREAIWSDLWGAYIQHPLTGIGSSYHINLDWMGGMFEVHNGLLDILIVHGLLVFAVTIVMLIHRLLALREKAENPVSKSAQAAVFAILAASFMENFVIVPPFLLLFLVLIAIARSA